MELGLAVIIAVLASNISLAVKDTEYTFDIIARQSIEAMFWGLLGWATATIIIEIGKLHRTQELRFAVYGVSSAFFGFYRSKALDIIRKK